MIRFSANLGFMWADRELPERIAAAGRAGFRAVELHWPYATPPGVVRDACAAAGVTLLALNTVPGDMAAGEFGLGAVPGRETDFAASFKQALDYCLATGARSIHAMAGVVDDNAQSSATFVGNLRRASAAAAEHGVTVLLEPINRFDKPGYFYDRVERAAEIIGEVGAHNVRLMFDAYHVGRGQGDVLGRLATHMPLIGHIQIAAVPSRAEPDEGELDHAELFAALAASGYAGWIGCEYKPRGDTDAGLVWREKLGLSSFG